MIPAPRRRCEESGEQQEGAWLCQTGEGGGRPLSEASDRPGGLPSDPSLSKLGNQNAQTKRRGSATKTSDQIGPGQIEEEGLFTLC